jgi:hypothetical protein
MIASGESGKGVAGKTLPVSQLPISQVREARASLCREGVDTNSE